MASLKSSIPPSLLLIVLIPPSTLGQGLVDNKMTLDRVINDGILKQAQQELRKEGRLSQ